MRTAIPVQIFSILIHLYLDLCSCTALFLIDTSIVKSYSFELEIH